MFIIIQAKIKESQILDTKSSKKFHIMHIKFWLIQVEFDHDQKTPHWVTRG